MATVIETIRTPRAVIRLQKRGNKFDVIRNTTGYTWWYVAKAVTESSARSTFELLRLQSA
jgi:hypothetical protein